MNEKVLVTIKGIQYDYDESDTGIQTTQQGIYKYISDRHIITYEEFIEGESSNPASVKNLLKINNNDKEISLARRGAIFTNMVFKEKFIHTGLYRTPFGTLKMRIATSELIINEKADTINATIKYALELNHQHMSDCSIIINIS